MPGFSRRRKRPGWFLLLAILAVAARLDARSDEPAAPADPAAHALDIRDLAKSGQPPRGLKQAAPVYPEGASRAGLVGAVTVEFIIDQQGNVINPLVVESNNPWFDRPAIDAILGWKFSPGMMNGRPVNVRAQQLIEFDLTNRGRVPDYWHVAKGKDHDKLPAEIRWETPPVPKRTLFPVYPFEQLQAGQAGRARINYLVGPAGRVVMARVLEATTPEFGQAVLAMIDAWEFEPARKRDGTACMAMLGIQYEFKPNTRSEVPVTKEAREILHLLEKKSNKIATTKELDRPPHPLSTRPPVYPSQLREKGEAGEAVIEFYLDHNGDAQLPRIISSTQPEFGYAAVQAVATWRFSAPKRSGRETIVRVRVPVEFTLAPELPLNAAGR